MTESFHLPYTASHTQLEMAAWQPSGHADDGNRIEETAKSGNSTMWTGVSTWTPWVFHEERVGAGSSTVVLVVRRSNMPILIEIVCTVGKAEAVRTLIEESCQVTGDLLIGRCVYEQINEVLLIVQLVHATSVRRYVTTLSQQLQQEVILSFQLVNGDLVKMSFHPTVDVREQMRHFPLCPGDSWYPALHEPHQAYVCIRRPLLGAKQAAWLLHHEVVWVYV